MPKKILAVEGKSDKHFFEAYLKGLNIYNVEIKSVDGKDKFANDLPELLKSDDLLMLAIARDADRNAEGAFNSIKNALEKARPDLPFSLITPDKPNTFSNGIPRIGIFIIQNELEDLCLKSLKFPDVEPCIENFFDCLPNGMMREIKKQSKAKLQTYLSAMREHCNSLGVAAQNGYFDFESEAFIELRKFVEQLR